MEYKRLSMHAIATVLPHESSVHLSQAGITCFPLDVTNEDSVSELKLKLEELTGGRLHILVNCAYASVPPKSHRSNLMMGQRNCIHYDCYRHRRDCCTAYV